MTPLESTYDTDVTATLAALTGKEFPPKSVERVTSVPAVLEIKVVAKFV